MSAPLQAQACHISRRHASFIHWRWDLSFHFASCLKWSHGITWRPPRSGLLLCPESLPRLVCKQRVVSVLLSLNFQIVWCRHLTITHQNKTTSSLPKTDIAPENRPSPPKKKQKKVVSQPSIFRCENVSFREGSFFGPYWWKESQIVFTILITYKSSSMFFLSKNDGTRSLDGTKVEKITRVLRWHCLRWELPSTFGPSGRDQLSGPR